MNNKNILEEIEANIIKNGDASYTSIDICIKNNNIFGLLFLSEILPNINNIIQIFQNLIDIIKKEQENNYFTLIICICSEEKEDFEKTLLKISKLSCFILPYNSEYKEKIINKFNILFYSDYLSKSPDYGRGNWYCDICGAKHAYSDLNFYCDLCGYDVCDICYEKNKKY